MKRLQEAIALFFTVAAATPLPAAVAQAGGAVAGPPRTLVGTWRGTSICRPVGKPACHDEIAVYHFRRAVSSTAPAGARPDANGSTMVRLVWQADKVVDGVEEEMGTMACTYEATSGDLLCPMRDWRWVFHVARGRGDDTLSGTLRNPAGVVWRDVRVTKSSSIP